MQVGIVDRTTRDWGGRDLAAGRIQISELMLSQSGVAFPKGYGSRDQKPLVPPGMEGFFDRMEVTGLSPSGTRFKNSFEIDDAGKLVPNTRTRPLGHVPYEVALIGKDGSRWTTAVDITPSKIRESSQGYYDVGRLEMVRQAPPPPDEVRLGEFLLSQSGRALPGKYGETNPPLLVPNNDGFFTEMIVTSLSSSRTRSSNSYRISAGGQLEASANGRPLGDVPFEITLVGRDGSTYTAGVDISSRRLGRSSPGAYETIEGLVVRRTDARAEAGTDAPLSEGDAAFLQSGGATKQSPSITSSPVGIYFRGRGA